MEFDESVHMCPWVAKLKENLPTVMCTLKVFIYATRKID